MEAQDTMLSSEITNFYDNHGVKFEMITNYILKAFTLKNYDECRKIVAVLDMVIPENAKNYSYLDYVSKKLDADQSKWKKDEGR